MKKIITSSLFVFALAGFLSFVFFSHREAPVASEPETISSEELVVAAEEERAPESEDSRAQPEPEVVAGTVSTEPEQREEIIEASLKQTEVRQSVGEERVYYPLAVPNDPAYSIENWSTTQMNAEPAWDFGYDGSGSVIAVLDTGFALDHEDLASQWYENTGETGFTILGDICWTGITADKSTNNCDDDANGYVDDWRGWDFYNGTNNPGAGQDNPNGDGVSHGTETAGLAGAAGNNGTGIVTLAWNAQLMPLKVLSDDGPGYTSDIVAAIYYAVDNGATVINMSLGGNDPDSALEAATDYAYEHGVTVVAAAGNCGTGSGEACEEYETGIIGYPARNPHVISVGAVDSAGNRANFSSYGDFLDVAASGSGAIYAPTWTPSNGATLYVTGVYGTSYSAPYVASLAALLQSVDATLTPDGIMSIILGTSQKTGVSGGIYSTMLGHGIVDAAQAVTVAEAIALGGEGDLELYATGNYKSEHSYTASTTVGAGCETESVSAYCTVWIRDVAGLYDRVLPYTLSSDNYASWSWNASIVPGATIELVASSGNAVTPSYIMIDK